MRVDRVVDATSDKKIYRIWYLEHRGYGEQITEMRHNVKSPTPWLYRGTWYGSCHHAIDAAKAHVDGCISVNTEAFGGLVPFDSAVR